MEMSTPTKEEIKSFLKTHRTDWPRERVASSIGVEKSTLDKCLSTREMSEAMRYDIAKLVGMIQEAPAPALPLPNMAVVIEPTKEEYTQWNKAALKQGMLVEEWCILELNARAEQMLADQFNVVALPDLAKVAEDQAEYQAKVIDPAERYLDENEESGEKRGNS